MYLAHEKIEISHALLARPSSQNVQGDRPFADGPARKLNRWDKREPLATPKSMFKQSIQIPRHCDSIVLPLRTGNQDKKIVNSERVPTGLKTFSLKTNSITSEKKFLFEKEMHLVNIIPSTDHRHRNSNLALQNLKFNPGLQDRQTLTFGKSTLKMKDFSLKSSLIKKDRLNFDLRAQESKHLSGPGPLNSHRPSKPISAILAPFGTSTTSNKAQRQQPRNVFSDNEDTKPLSSNPQLNSVCENPSNQSLKNNSLRHFLSDRFQVNDSKSSDRKSHLMHEETPRRFEISQSSRSIDSDTQIRSILKTSSSLSAEKKHVKIDESRNVLHIIAGRPQPDDFQASLRKNLDFNVPNLYNIFLNNSLSDENGLN